MIVTGYLIATPLAMVGGVASSHFVMGYIRFLHFAAGYLLAIGLIFRAYWAYAGNEHARQIFMPPLLSRGHPLFFTCINALVQRICGEQFMVAHLFCFFLFA